MNETGESGREPEGSEAPLEEQAASAVGGESAADGTTVTWESSAVAEPDLAEDAAMDDMAAAAAIAGGEDGSGEEEPKNKWKWWALVLLFIFLAGFIVLLILSRSDTSEVPDVRNMTVEDATASSRIGRAQVG